MKPMRYPSLAGLALLASLTMLASIFGAGAADAQVGGDLNISPKRVVFEGAQKSSTVFVYNRGGSAVSYKIELIDRVMTPDGQIRAADELAKTADGAAAAARLKSAAAMIQYTPRRVTLAPGQSQTIRLRMLAPTALADGEYRTTLTVSALPPEDAGLTAEQAVDAAGRELSVKVIALFGVSIPLIVRRGPHEVHAAFQDAKVDRTGLHLMLLRQGAGSIYGDIELHRGGAKGEVVGALKGVGVYEEVDRRPLDVTLTKPVVPGEALTLLFRDDDAKAGTVLASEALKAS
jgi:P pilus assembly chaperone PapD